MTLGKKLIIKNPKFKIGGIVRISKYNNIFSKVDILNWSEEVFVITKVKNTVPWIYAINDLNGEEIVGNFTKRNCKNQIKKSLELKK